MRDIIITANDAGRRLDRFLRKYLRNASLGEIYKLIRKDVKVDGRRRNESYMLNEGEVLTLYISDDVLASLTGEGSAGRAGSGKTRAASSSGKAKRQFRIIYEDDKVLIVSKPYGLLTHGDSHEKKNHLANQVKDYLIEKGEYDPRSEKVFSPAPANRLDRNTTGLVLFGKTSAALKALNEAIREDLTDKYYLTVACGVIDKELTLTGSLTKDERANKVRIVMKDDERGGSGKAADAHGDTSTKSRDVITEVMPQRHFSVGGGPEVTLTEIRLVTGRSHQIRAHLAGIGHPLAGDAKYAHAADDDAVLASGTVPSTGREIDNINEYFARRYRITTQLLHAQRISFAESGLPEEIEYLAGKSFTAPLPPAFERITGDHIG
ncbi:MAG: RluA family pseudouridine synthase [Mogibacterium sp.]|nr:RluA family pseudouridine synthase [Mogibacterium sp.]